MANRLNWQVITEDANVVSYNVYRSIVGTESANDEPFNLSDGMTLTLEIDGVATTVTFFAGDFTNINNAMSQEIVDVINNLLSSASSHIGVSGSVYIRSLNQTGSIKITGGTANSVLGFPLVEYSEKSHFLKIASVPAATGVIEYIDTDGRSLDWYKVSAVDDLSTESAMTTEKQAGPGRNPVCLVYGKLQNGQGYPIPDQEIKAVIEYPPNVDGVTTSWVTRDEVKTLSLRDGTFELELLQNASYEVTIPSIEYSRIVSIPAQAQANLFSLDFETKDLEHGGEEFNF